MDLEIPIHSVAQSRIATFDSENIQFGKVFADHMYRVDYIDGRWQSPRIEPYAPILLSPATSALHYGQAVFEGMKAYKDREGNPQIFRPLENLHRLNLSAQRMCMPQISEHLFIDGLKALVRTDRNWIPVKEGSALYLRPFMFATDDFVGVRSSNNFTFIIFSCPVNSYYTKPLRVKIANRYVRAWDGGAGFAKAAGNYGISMLPTKEAQAEGFDQLIWMDGREFKHVEESGTMNVFFVVGDKVITPQLDGCILDGVTRKSCIQLLKAKGVAVEERKITIDELIAAHGRGELTEAFGTGTAASVADIKSIHYEGLDYELPLSENRIHSNYLRDTLDGIKTSRLPDTYGWMEKA
jgi:branched-chain amino acid aminotransferase